MRRQLPSLALVALVVVVVACTERYPRPFEPPAPAATPATPTPTSSLDARPVSATCKAPLTRGVPRIGIRPVTSAKLESPVELTFHGGRLYVLELDGKVLRVSADGASTALVIDVADAIVSGGESGLLGIAFHPRFTDNGFVYLYYTARNASPAPAGVPFQSAIVRYHSPDGGLTLDPASARRVIGVDQPFSNHNGGTIAFGPDGMLYLGLGDGGSGGDPLGHGQNKGVLLGKMLRIDVDGGEPYAIPPTNPFATGGGRPEIFALGLRNPYRFRFDAVTGDLWVGDVGQGAREEIDRVVLGGNYGWNVREGKSCYEPLEGCDPTGLLDPVVDHGRSEATSITGGVVYRGADLPALSGKYVYGDFGAGTFWAISTEGRSPVPERLDEGLPRLHPTAFAIDPEGEIVFTEYARNAIFRIVPPAPAGSVEEPATLEGCE